eukprot:14572961-Alexandrium_andersonii.AAC.1
MHDSPQLYWPKIKKAICGQCCPLLLLLAMAPKKQIATAGVPKVAATAKTKALGTGKAKAKAKVEIEEPEVGAAMGQHSGPSPVSYTHLRAHETSAHL